MLLFDENEQLRIHIHGYDNLPDKFVFFDRIEGTNGYLGVPLLVERNLTEGEFWRGNIQTWLSRGLVSLSEIVRLSPPDETIIYQAGRNHLLELDRETLTGRRINKWRTI